MTTKPPSGLAASGTADDPDIEQITKEHNGDEGAQDISIDPSEDVTVEASEDVTTEAMSETPHPTLRGGATPGTVGASPGQRAPTLLGVPIQSLPLPGLSANSGDSARQISYDDEITVLAPASSMAPMDPLAVLDELDRPSITDDDEEETKVEPAEAAMKAAESMDDVTTALSAQASLEREKALRRSAPAAAPSSGGDLEFEDPEADDQEEESLDDELDDDDEVISAGGAIEEEEEDDGATDGVATATFMKPADSTSLSGLLNPRRPPTGNPYGRDGFGARLPTPYPPPQSPIPAPSTSPFASRLGPAPAGTPYPGRPTSTSSMPAIQVPPPSGKATTASEPGFLTRHVQMQAWVLIVFVGGALFAGTGLGSLVSGKKAPSAPTVIVAKPTAPPVPAPPVVEPVQPSAPTQAATETKQAEAPAVKPSGPATAGTDTTATGTTAEKTDKTDDTAPETGLWKPTPPKKVAAPKAHKVAVVDTSDDGAPKAAAAPKPAIATAKPAAPKPAVAASPKPVATAKGKKPGKVWVDPFAN